MQICRVFIIFFSLSTLLLSACTTSKSYNTNPKYAFTYSYLDDEDELDEEEEIDELAANGGEVFGIGDDADTKMTSDDSISETRSYEEILADQQSKETFPLVYNPMVAKWVHYFQGKGRKNFVKWLGRSTRYLDIMEDAIEKYELPKELVYLSMIESGFNNRAYSRAHAVGMWQFIRSTGRAYGLKINWWVDERRDPHKSAEAAARHLRDLYYEFDNWYLAAAAYNAGTGKIKKAIRLYGTSNFWELTRKRKRYLKPETKNYVPKLIAATLIAKNLKYYGFSKSEISYQVPLKYDVYKVSVPVDLYTVARLTGHRVQTIRDLNPELRRNIVPPSSQNYTLRIPQGKRAHFSKQFAQVKHKFKRTKYITHRVRRGENLNMISRKYGVSLSEVLEMNHIRNSRYIRTGQSLMIPPGGKKRSQIASSSYRPASKYKVRRGDTLAKIARKYRVSIASLKNTNHIRNARSLSIGKTLKIPARGTPKVVASTQKYRIKRGDTLSKIARKHGVTIASLKKTNTIRNVRSLKVGKILTISKPGTSNIVHHTVRRGENISGISEHYSVSMVKLLNWNNLSKRSIIKPGQKLKVFVNK